jgi:RNA polymerase sigma-70 factor (ECF subfamily)
LAGLIFFTPTVAFWGPLKPQWAATGIANRSRVTPDTKDPALADEVRALIQRCLGGDQTAMLALVELYQGQVFGLCYRMLGQRQDAEDMAQETFVRALRSLKQWDSERAFLPWLLAIAGNRCRTCLANRMRRPPTISLLEPLPDRQPEAEPGGHLAEEVERALRRLREEYRVAFLLFHDEQLSYAEMGAALKRPVGTVKTWVHRARRELIEMLRKREAVGEVSHAIRRI